VQRDNKEIKVEEQRKGEKREQGAKYNNHLT
jgi:hypothetical protein